MEKEGFLIDAPYGKRSLTVVIWVSESPCFVFLSGVGRLDFFILETSLCSIIQSTFKSYPLPHKVVNLFFDVFLKILNNVSSESNAITTFLIQNFY